MSRRELVNKIETIEHEIEELKRIINVGNLESFELIINKVKEDIIRNINEEDFKTAKTNMAKINKMRDFTDYIEKQTDVIEQKEQELDDLRYELDNYQLGLFEEFIEDDEPVEVGLKRNGKSLRTGDIYQNSGDEDNIQIFMIVRSKEMPDKFALLSNSLEGEQLLQYPKNQELLNDCVYLGNVYYKNDAKAQEAFEELEKSWAEMNED